SSISCILTGFPCIQSHRVNPGSHSWTVERRQNDWKIGPSVWGAAMHKSSVRADVVTNLCVLLIGQNSLLHQLVRIAVRSPRDYLARIPSCDSRKRRQFTLTCLFEIRFFAPSRLL